MGIAAFLFLMAALLVLVSVTVFVVLPLFALYRWRERHVPSGMSEAQYVEDERRLAEEIRGVLASSAIPAGQRSELLRQLQRVPENISGALGKLQRLRRVKKIAQRSEGAGAVLQEIARLEAQILAELRRTHQTLLEMPVALMKLDLARGDRDFQRMVAALDEANRRLHDLAESYEELRGHRAWSAPN